MICAGGTFAMLLKVSAMRLMFVFIFGWIYFDTKMTKEESFDLSNFTEPTA
jgi:hypothetical protein